eukprot:1156235-Pelagomonas_calceolata.AAC.10
MSPKPTSQAGRWRCTKKPVETLSKSCQSCQQDPNNIISATFPPGGYVTEVNPSSEASQEALRRQSELRGQKLRNLPRKWSTDEPLEAPGPGGVLDVRALTPGLQIVYIV